MGTAGSVAKQVQQGEADHAERHVDEFGHQADFAEYRNRIGGPLLLPKTFHASYGDLPRLPSVRESNGFALRPDRSLQEGTTGRSERALPGDREVGLEPGRPFGPSIIGF